MKKIPKPLKVVCMILIFLIAFYLYGRFGWKLYGFRKCEKAVIYDINVTPDYVEISGDYPGSFPCGYIGCTYDEINGELYIGFRFSPLFGMFDQPSFHEKINTRNEITKIYEKTQADEELIWPK